MKFFSMFKKPALSTNVLSSEIATRSSLDYISNFLSMLPDPDPILTKIGKGNSAYYDLLTDSHLWSVIQQRKSGVLGLDFQLDKNDSNDILYNLVADLLNDSDIDIYNVIDQVLDCVLFGYSVFEIMWEKKNGYFIPSQILEKPRDWFYYDNTNNLKLKKNGKDDIDLPDYKFLVATHKKSYINPYGQKTISRCFWPVSFKRGGLKFWVTFTEKYGMPYIIGKLPRGVEKEKYNQLLLSLDNMVQDAVAVIPDDGSVEVKEFARQSSVESYERFLYFMNTEISKAIITQTLTTEVQDKGTYAASSTHQEQLQAVVKADKRIVQSFINKLIKYIALINFGDVQTPIFKFTEEERIDKTLAERDEILSRSGIKFTKKYFVKTYKFDEDDIDENVPEQTNNDFAENDNKTVEQGTQLDYTPNDKMLQLQTEQILKPILDLVNNSADYDEIMNKLAETFPKMNTNQLESILTKIIFIAETSGRLNNGN